MAEIKDLVEKMEDELRPYAIPLSEASNEQIDRFNELSDIKYVLERMPLTDEQVIMLAYLPQLLENIEALRLDPERDNQTVAEAVADYLIGAAPQYRNGLLHDKIRAEREKYLAGVIDSLMKMDEISVSDFLSMAYEATLKQEIYLLLGNSDAMDDRMVALLLSSEQPLDGIYQEWIGNDLSIEDALLETVDGFLYNCEKDMRSRYEYGGKLPDYIVERFENAAQTEPDDELSEDLEP